MDILTWFVYVLVGSFIGMLISAFIILVLNRNYVKHEITRRKQNQKEITDFLESLIPKE